ncbi:MAG: ribosome silencing factor [Mailhella sp.]|nr:ribosome silencing factor [Mailhella sp.]
MPKEKKFSQQPAAQKAESLIASLEDHKAHDLSAFSLPQGDPLAEVVIICTASSARHARSLADAAVEACKANNFEYLHTEGYQEGDWILVDMNDIILHIFLGPSRERYKLEALLNDAAPLSIAGSAPADFQ